MLAVPGHRRYSARMSLRQLGTVALTAALLWGPCAPAFAAPPTRPPKGKPTQTVTIAPPAPAPTRPTTNPTAPVAPPPPTQPADPAEPAQPGDPAAPPPAAAAVATTLTVTVTAQDGGLLLVSGVLTDAAGAGVPDAEIHLSYDGVAYVTATTGADGAWSSLVDPAGALTPGIHTFTADYAGGAGRQPSRGQAILRSGPAVTVLTATSEPAAFASGGLLTISGRLADDTGAPVPGARVKAGIDDAAADHGSALTTADGAYSFTVQLPATDAARPLTIHVRFDGDPAYQAARITIPGNLAPRSPSPTVSRPPTPSASASASPTAGPSSATPSPTAAATTGTTSTPWSPALGTILAIFAASLAALVGLGVVAYRWHLRN